MTISYGEGRLACPTNAIRAGVTIGAWTSRSRSWTGRHPEVTREEDRSHEPYGDEAHHELVPAGEA